MGAFSRKDFHGLFSQSSLSGKNTLEVFFRETRSLGRTGRSVKVKKQTVLGQTAVVSPGREDREEGQHARRKRRKGGTVEEGGGKCSGPKRHQNS